MPFHCRWSRSISHSSPEHRVEDTGGIPLCRPAIGVVVVTGFASPPTDLEVQAARIYALMAMTVVIALMALPVLVAEPSVLIHLCVAQVAESAKVVDLEEEVKEEEGKKDSVWEAAILVAHAPAQSEG